MISHNYIIMAQIGVYIGTYVSTILLAVLYGGAWYNGEPPGKSPPPTSNLRSHGEYGYGPYCEADCV